MRRGRDGSSQKDVRHDHLRTGAGDRPVCGGVHGEEPAGGVRRSKKEFVRVAVGAG